MAIELKITDGLADYINEEEIQEQVSESVRYILKDEINKFIQNDKNIKNIIIKQVVSSCMNVLFNEEIINILRDKIKESIKNMSDFDVKYACNISDIMNEQFEVNIEENKKYIKDVLYKCMSNITFNTWEIKSKMNDYIVEQVLRHKDELNIDEIISEFIENYKT